MAAIGSDRKTTTLPAFAGKFGRYVRSPSTRMAAFVGLLTYLSYAYAHGSWANPTLIGVSVFVGVFLPSYAKLSNKSELWANNRFGFVTGGRLGRFIPQYAFNLAVFWIMSWGGALNRDGIASVGGIASAALVTTLASQGTQYLGLYLFARGVGDTNRNVQIGVVVRHRADRARHRRPARRARGLPGRSGLVSRRRCSSASACCRTSARWWRPRAASACSSAPSIPSTTPILRSCAGRIEERGLEKVIIHPTLIPRLHAEAFRKGQLRVGRLENGFQIYETTDKADVNVDYFPTGRKFLPPETRQALIELAVAEAGLGDKVEVAFYREIYDTKGFQGVIAEIKRRYPGVRLHCLHGTDFGGMLRAADLR